MMKIARGLQHTILPSTLAILLAEEADLGEFVKQSFPF
jgi:hypothetical protein